MKKIITKQDIMEEMARTEKYRYGYADVRQMFLDLEWIITRELRNADEEGITIKLFDGLSIEADYVDEKIIKHPKTGKSTLVPAKLWAKAKITRYFNRKINDMREELAKKVS